MEQLRDLIVADLVEAEDLYGSVVFETMIAVGLGIGLDEFLVRPLASQRPFYRELARQFGEYQVVTRPDGSFSVTLAHPVNEVTEVSLRTALVRDRYELNINPLDAAIGTLKEQLLVVERLSGVPEATLRQMRVQDWSGVRQALGKAMGLDGDDTAI